MADYKRFCPSLVELVQECLHNVPDERPTTDDLLARLQRIKKEIAGCEGGPMHLDIMVQLRMAKKDRRIKELTQQQV